MDGCHRASKKISLEIESMAQSVPLREASAVKKMNDQLLLLSLKKITYYFKIWTTGSNVLQKIYCLYKNAKVAVLKNNSTPERRLRLKVLQKSSSFKKVAFPKITLASELSITALLKYLLYLL